MTLGFYRHYMCEAEVLKHLNFQFTVFLYGTEAVKVFAGTFENFPVVFKVLSLPPNVNYLELEKESRILLHIVHENVVTIYNYQWVEWNAAWYLVIVMEACEKDLANDIQQRSNIMYQYSEQELRSMMITLVRAFAYMQKQGLAHRDIKPGNIFLSHETLKIGDFGSARYLQTDLVTATLIGSPLYLSPILKQGLLFGQSQVAHNVYKSDVYSLGLTFIELATLQPPLVSIQGGDTQILTITWGLNYSEDMKRIIAWMLTKEEENRPDFVELDGWITSTYYQSIPHPAEQQSFPDSVPDASDPSTADSVHTLIVEDEESLINIPAGGQETKLSQFPPKISVHVEEKKDEIPHCLFCKKSVLMKWDSPIVQLKCSPNTHVYCSPKCLSADVCQQKKRGKAPVCIVCKASIGGDDLTFYGLNADGSEISILSRIARFFLRSGSPEDERQTEK